MGIYNKTRRNYYLENKIVYMIKKDLFKILEIINKDNEKLILKYDISKSGKINFYTKIFIESI